ncbi:MAG: 3-isopropylmalate dehydratase small subunit [Deltaproteobacteria bacterium]|nr:3-isopropylmalate dehydratase small subunit [Deltaproteobacteria bacterium]
MIKGQVHKFGADIDTDAIISGRYSGLSEPSDLGRHCMENIDPDFSKRVKTGDIIVASSNFGCGSSREFAPLAVKGAGISCVIAISFARIFFRNAINIGLPLLECAEASEKIENGDILEVDLATGEIRDISRDLVFRAIAYPDFVNELISAGGLIEYARKKLGKG